MAKDVLVYVECRDNAARKVSFELLSKGKDLADTLSSKVYAVVMGHQVAAIADSLRTFADTVLHVDDEKLKDYRWDTYTSAFEDLLHKYKPYLVIGGSTILGKDLFPRLAARSKSPLISDAIGIELSGNSLRVKKPIFGGRIHSWLEWKNDSAIYVTFRPNSFSVQEGNKSGEIIEEHPAIAEDSRLVLLNTEKKPSAQVDLQEADFIVCGGRGMKGPEHFGALEELAGILDGRVGASRGAVDNKWRDYDDQIGKSGKTVSPKLYVGCGISGALHHIMGMDTSKVIVAINKDANAPIFQYADYGIAGDLFEVVPILTEELKRAKEKTSNG
ncbi:MAG TPA: electron transfer flavoprotein subunit alpha/FixB family protein [Syntrophorhabdaceae bacterium]|nr:electron transfer flavoprotein subunit alpha/FixB family protein [Syntrophorhabdaceae bacterium]